MAHEERDPPRRSEIPPSAEIDVVDQIIEQGRVGSDAAAREHGRNLVKQFVSQVLEGSIAVGRDTESMINARIAQIDHLLSLQLNEILHHPDFQRLEASWRGLRYLATACLPTDGVTTRVLNVSKKELLRDFEYARTRLDSALFHKVHDEAIGLPGGTPFGALVADYYFGASGPDVELLERLADVAAAAHAPVLAGAAPELLGLDAFPALAGRTNLAQAFDTAASAKWQAFRTTEASRYVGLTLPRVLLREPYGSETVPVKAFHYDERVDGTSHDAYLWGNAAWMLAARIVRAFATTRWFADLRGVRQGGLVDGLPVHEFRADPGVVERKGPTEVPITYRQEQAIAELGLIPLVARAATRDAVFNWVRAVHVAPVPPSRTGIARPGVHEFTDLRTILCVSRIAQHLVVLWHATPHDAATPQTVAPLRAWLASYVHSANAPEAGSEAESEVGADASRPLRSATLEIDVLPQSDGRRVAVLEAWPAFQLEDGGGPVRVRLTLLVVAGGAAASARAAVVTEDDSRSRVPTSVPSELGDGVAAGEPLAPALRTVRDAHDGGAAAPVATEARELFALHSASPSADPDAVLRDMRTALGSWASVLNHVVGEPLEVRGSVAADRPLVVLAEFAAAESSRVELDITALLSGSAFDRDQLAVLARYPSGVVRGLSAEVVLRAGRYVLSLLDPLALLDPGARVERRPTAPLSCTFDVVMLEAPTRVS